MLTAQFIIGIAYFKTCLNLVRSMVPVLCLLTPTILANDPLQHELLVSDLDMHVKISCFLLHNVSQGLEDILKFLHHILRWIQSFKLVNLFEKRPTFLQTCFHDTQLFKNCIGLTILHFVAKHSPNHQRKCSLDQSANEVGWQQNFYYRGIVIEISDLMGRCITLL